MAIPFCQFTYLEADPSLGGESFLRTSHGRRRFGHIFRGRRPHLIQNPFGNKMVNNVAPTVFTKEAMGVIEKRYLARFESPCVEKYRFFVILAYFISRYFLEVGSGGH